MECPKSKNSRPLPLEFLDRSRFCSLLLHVSLVNTRAHKFHGNEHAAALLRNIKELLPEVFQLLQIRQKKKNEGASTRNMRENGS